MNLMKITDQKCLDLTDQKYKENMDQSKINDCHHFQAEYPLLANNMMNNNNPINNLNNDERLKFAVDLTTAQFRMLVNAEDFARPYCAKVDNNLPTERYSNVDLVIHFSEIAFSGLTDAIVKGFIQGHRMFRRLYFNATYCLYFEKLVPNSPLFMYKLNKNQKSGLWVDQIMIWFPIFPGGTDQVDCVDNGRFESLNQEKQCFSQHLKSEFRKILLEFYEIIDGFPNNLIVKFIELVERHITVLSEYSLKPFEWINEVCKKCGEAFPNKADLINHHDFNACRLPPVHRCQCGNIFRTHDEWQSHCVNIQMTCPTFGWHIWRQKRLPTDFIYICDGCQHIFGMFLKFWHHCCCCPFFLAFVIGNCQYCTQQTRQDYYNLDKTQQNISQPHSDRVGITIIQEWANITEIKFNVKLATNEEPLVLM